MQQVCTSAFSVMKFCAPFYAKIETKVDAPQPTTVSAMNQVLYVLKQGEKLMSPSSFNMMRKALFTVCLLCKCHL